MTRPIQRCPEYQFKPRIVFGNDLCLPTSLYGVEIPNGLTMAQVRAPTYVSPTQMLEKLRSRSSGRTNGGLGVVHGLTTAEFSIAFPNMTRQWPQVSAQGRGPMRQFQGGDVYLQITLDVFILEGDRPAPNDDISQQIFAIIMEHELEHVADEIDLVRRWMPARIRRDERVRRYLTDAQALSEQGYQHWIAGTGLTNWVKNGIWAPEHNRRSAHRDSPANYGALQSRIDQLRIRASNPR